VLRDNGVVVVGLAGEIWRCRDELTPASQSISRAVIHTSESAVLSVLTFLKYLVP